MDERREREQIQQQARQQARQQAHHKNRHVKLHTCLDELIGDWISHTEGLPSQTSLLEFMTWAHGQTIKPNEKL